MGAFLTQATIAFDPTYVYWVMEELRHREIQPEPRFIYNIEQFRDIVKKGIISKVIIILKLFIQVLPQFRENLSQ